MLRTKRYVPVTYIITSKLLAHYSYFQSIKNIDIYFFAVSSATIVVSLIAILVLFLFSVVYFIMILIVSPSVLLLRCWILLRQGMLEKSTCLLEIYTEEIVSDTNTYTYLFTYTYPCTCTYMSIYMYTHKHTQVIRIVRTHSRVPILFDL